MSKIVCDIIGRVRFHFDNDIVLTVTPNLILTPEFNIGDPREYVIYENVTLPDDLSEYWYKYDGKVWMRGDPLPS